MKTKTRDSYERKHNENLAYSEFYHPGGPQSDNQRKQKEK